MREDFEARTGGFDGSGGGTLGKNLPQVVSFVVLAKQLEEKVFAPPARPIFWTAVWGRRGGVCITPMAGYGSYELS